MWPQDVTHLELIQQTLASAFPRARQFHRIRAEVQRKEMPSRVCRQRKCTREKPTWGQYENLCRSTPDLLCPERVSSGAIGGWRE
jgi:hypothetical protein